jgi:hypothetical protein
MDKAKEAALQAKAQAQQIAQQGQAKVATIQESRSVGELYRTLGEAYYNEQRHGGDRQAVVAALTALDQHFASATPGGAGHSAAAPDAAAAPTEGTPGAPPQQTPPGGSFTLGDV